MGGRPIILAVLFVALALVSVAAPFVLYAQEEAPAEEAASEESLGETPSFWNREFIGLQGKTWVVIVVLIVAIFVVLEGLGWLLAIAGVGYLLWLLLR